MRERKLGSISAETADLAKGATLSDAKFAPFLASWAKRLASTFEDGLKAREKLEARILKTVGRALAKIGGRKALTGASALALIANACTPLFSRPEPTPISSDPAPKATETFEPTPTPGFYPGEIPSEVVLAVAGEIPGMGGLELEGDVLNNENIQAAMNRENMWPIEEGGRLSSIFRANYNGQELRICVPGLTEKIFSPHLIPTEDATLRYDIGIKVYGVEETGEERFRAPIVHQLNGYPRNAVCVNAVINVDGHPLGSNGTVLTMLIDRETGEIFGSRPAVYGTGEIIGIDPQTLETSIDGSAVMFEGPGMLQLTPTPTEIPTTTPHPEVLPRDITGEERLYFRDRGQGRHVAPLGLYYSPAPYGDLPPDPEGSQRWLLSGILLDAPQMNNEGYMVFKIGMPNLSGVFSVVNVFRKSVFYENQDPINGRLLYPIYTAPHGLGREGYNLYGGTAKFLAVEEFLTAASRAVGRQIAVEFFINQNREAMHSFIDSELAVNKCHNLDYCLEMLDRIKNEYPVALTTFRAIRSSNYSRYDGKDFYVWVEHIYIPTVQNQ